MSPATVCLAALFLCIGCGKTRPTAYDVDLPPGPQPIHPAPAPAPVTGTKVADRPIVEEPEKPATLPAPAPIPATSTTPPPATQAITPATVPASQPSPATSPAPTSQPSATTSPASRDRRVLSAVEAAMQDFRQRMDEGNTPAAVDPIITLADRVRSIAILRVPTASLCSKVEGFGVYEPVEPRLRANHETNVVLYCELTGFHSRQGDRAMWETRVAQDVVLLDSNAREVWKDSAPAVVDQCRNLRRDFYVARILRFPATIAPGQYTLKISMTDQFSNELAETTLPMEFVKN